MNSVFNLIEFANRCDGCGQAGDLGPMLHDHTWRQIAEGDEHTLCAKCMLERTIERLEPYADVRRPPAVFVVRLVHADGRAAAEPCRVAGRDRRYGALGQARAVASGENQ